MKNKIILLSGLFIFLSLIFLTPVVGLGEAQSETFSIELNVYKKWNLVPIYFLLDDQQDKIQLEKGTCKLQDFLVIFSHKC